MFLKLLPAISGKAAMTIQQKVHDWKLFLSPNVSLKEVASVMSRLTRHSLDQSDRARLDDLLRSRLALHHCRANRIS